MLDCSNEVPECTIVKAQFSILKVALIKINSLINVCYGIKKPENQDFTGFEDVRITSAFKRVMSSIENKRRSLQGLFRAAYLHLEEKSEVGYFSESIPEDFNNIKT
jgi:hypothetical protein